MVKEGDGINFGTSKIHVESNQKRNVVAVILMCRTA